jgi:uncharacterized protein YchJ
MLMTRGGKSKRFKISPKISLRKSVVTGPRRTLKVGRNDLCPCGSGQKYKNCCIRKGESFLRKMAKKQEKIKRSEIESED